MRGQLQVQFQWVFAIIGGFLFLLFFFMIIRTLIHTTDEANRRSLNFATDIILRASIANPDTFSRTDLPVPVTFRFSCQLAPPTNNPTQPRDYESSHVRVNNESYTPYALRHIPFFSPTTVKGDQLFTLTKTWRAPFPVARLLMVSNNHTHYVALAPVGWLARTKRFLTDENLRKFSFEVHSIAASGAATLSSRGADQYRYILFNTAFNSFYANLDNQFKRPENSALVVTSAHDDFRTGTLQFYDDLSTGAPSGPAINYYGSAMLDAAIFSGTRELYRCNMQKAYERLYIALATLTNKTQELSHQASDGALTPICGHQYDTILGVLTTLPFVAIQNQPRPANPYWDTVTQALPAYIYAVKWVLHNDDHYLACQHGPPNPTPGCTAPSVFQQAAIDDGPLAAFETTNRKLLQNDCPLIY